MRTALLKSIPMFKDQEALLFEVAAEVCYKMGGIHTVITSKVPYVQQLWGESYFLLGPFLPNQSYDGVFYATPEEDIPNAAVQQAVRAMREMGANVQVGRWLIEGRPFVILLDPTVLLPGYPEYMAQQLALHQCEMPPADSLIHLYFQFGHCVENFFNQLSASYARAQRIIVHFHEYMTTIALPAIKALGMRTVFTTHATVFGRDFAPSYQNLHRQLKEIDWRERSKGMSKYHQFCLGVEVAAAQQCHVLATVSETVAQECTWLLGRTPDMVTPNGLNMAALKAQMPRPGSARNEIAQAVQKHLKIDPALKGGKTYYFFTSGRYEYKNKGYGVIVDALGKLNAWLKQTNSKDTVVAFFITSQPAAFGSWLFRKARGLRRKLLSLTGRKDDIFMFDVQPDYYDCRLVNDCGRNKLWNRPVDRVKVLSHPEFLSRKSAAMPMDYLQFATSCDLGIFPSLYEPYGYTPLECVAVNVPAVISDVTGLGHYIANHTNIPSNAGMFIIERTTGADADNLFRALQQFLLHPKDYAESLEAIARRFDWSNLIKHYTQIYQKAIGHTPVMALTD